MSVSKLMAAVAASVLIATPALANQAASLSVAKAASVKAKTSAKKSNNIAPELGIGLGLLAVGAIVVIAVESSDSN